MMTTSTARAARAAYASDARATATPARLLTMLYDRLVLDLAGAERELAAGRAAVARDLLLHAQDIVLELRAALDPEAWEGGPGLARLYEFLITELVGANVYHDAARVAACRELVEPLRDAWHQAAATYQGQSA